MLGARGKLALMLGVLLHLLAKRDKVVVEAQRLRHVGCLAFLTGNEPEEPRQCIPLNDFGHQLLLALIKQIRRKVLVRNACMDVRELRGVKVDLHHGGVVHKLGDNLERLRLAVGTVCDGLVLLHRPPANRSNPPQRERHAHEHRRTHAGTKRTRTAATPPHALSS